MIASERDWAAELRREFPGVEYAPGEGNPAGINAVSAGVLVGRWYGARTPPYGVVFDQPRSCGGRH